MKFVNGNNCAVLFGIGGGLVTLASSSWIKSQNITVYALDLSRLIEFVGLLTCLVSAGAIIFLCGRWLVYRVVTLTIEATDDFIDPIYISKPASPNELKEIHEMGEDLFEGGVSSIKKMKEWHNVNPQIFHVIRNMKKGRKSKIEGYFCVIPLKKEASDLLRKGEITGKDFTTNHIASPIKAPNAVYVGAVAAVGFKSRGASLHKLLQYIQNLRNKGTSDVFTRPVTRDGMRLCKKFGFECIESDGVVKDKIHVLNEIF